MTTNSTSKPNVMCFSGLDPTGGAGIQADIEVLFSTGCHCLPVVTALTVQDTNNVVECIPTNPALLIEQARAVLEDIPVHAFKIGLLGDIQTVEIIHTLLQDYPDIPVVVDPVLRAGGGYEFSRENMAEAYGSLLLPLTTILTPNTLEMKALSPFGDSYDACASELLDKGCKNILLTGTHEHSSKVINRLYCEHHAPRAFEWPRLENEYHGSGCTLAAGLAAYLAHGLEIGEAAQQAQQFTWDALNSGRRVGFGQFLPNRSYWND
ncbi:MAG: hydroxymethylpyrimidine/phosphomethylpyrimidine kinase [Pseudohongiellaceae bacterium]|nr:hydroxymethylpyrimidine/phosphomethylpyrimidine kinase [Pseudohongiellaceae bacterium]